MTIIVLQKDMAKKGTSMSVFWIITANFLLWLITKLFKDDEKKMVDEMKDVITSAYKAL
jgi:hypothetical protein